MTVPSLLLLVVILTQADLGLQDDITPASTELLVSEGETASLSCTYSNAVNVNNLQWYRQNPGSKPEFIIMLFESSDRKVDSTSHPEYRTESKQISIPASLMNYTMVITIMTLVALLLFSTILGKSTESPIVPDTVVKYAKEGENVQLSCRYNGSADSLHWYRQFSQSVTQFLILDYQGTIINATPPVLGISIRHDNTAKQVSLKISSAEVSDSAVYYCALQPTVSGNPAALNKNPHSQDEWQ
ncbi:uncharacterized protein LOC121724255 [Alosa sapidissima]|uniref:uncharacterized protein LOC121724255 n=1 Tax=Alosa sapidissima TaxID=34773 RepID=UPI001C0991E4|nr:uncharacterized protein LOC121724255 [Alosa sapidissima]